MRDREASLSWRNELVMHTPLCKYIASVTCVLMDMWRQTFRGGGGWSGTTTTTTTTTTNANNNNNNNNNNSTQFFIDVSSQQANGP